MRARLLKHVLPALIGTALVLIAFGFVTATVYFIVKDAMHEEEAPGAPPNDAGDQAGDAPLAGQGALTATARRSTVSPEVEMTAVLPGRRETFSGRENPLREATRSR